MKNQLAAEAAKILGALRANPYPGRGIVVGLDDTGNFLVQVYWIMGRSENSRNRVFEYNEPEGRLYTVAADPSKVKDPSLIIYNAMEERSGWFVASNGCQTDDVIAGWRDSHGYGFRGGLNFEQTLQRWKYEPDDPNFTPRITAAMAWFDIPHAKISILRRSPWSDACERHIYTYDGIGEGFGHMIHTYSSDGDPLPSFRGEPLLVALDGDARNIANTFWNALDAENRVAIAVKMIPRRGPSYIVVINRYPKVA